MAALRRWISSMKRTSRSLRLVSRPARSPLRSSAGPLVTWMPTPSSEAMMWASDVLPRPGGPENRQWSSASPRLPGRAHVDLELLDDRRLAHVLVEGARPERGLQADLVPLDRISGQRLGLALLRSHGGVHPTKNGACVAVHLPALDSRALWPAGQGARDVKGLVFDLSIPKYVLAKGIGGLYPKMHYGPGQLPVPARAALAYSARPRVGAAEAAADGAVRLGHGDVLLQGQSAAGALQ